jgi:hypothetical protein
MAKEEGHRNVSKAWYDKTKSIESEIDRLNSTRPERETLTATFGRMEPDFTDNHFLLRPNGRELVPDQHAAEQLGAIVGMGKQYPRCLMRDAREGNAEALAFAFLHRWSEVPRNRSYLLHVHHGKILRGILPEGHFSLRNESYLRLLQRAIPDGRLSHWRGDDFTLYGNVLIPDTVRAEDDSEYGAMVSLSNCELGKRRLMQQPSVFRAICWNGNIWGQTKGVEYKLNRRGVVDRAELERQLIRNIEEQIPLALSGLDRFLGTRTYTTTVSMKAIVAQVCKDYHLSREYASSVLRAWHQETQHTPDLRHTLFGVINGFTRAGQAHDNDTWVRFDTIGGSLAALERDKWDGLVSRAATLKAKDVDRAFARWSLDSIPAVSV